MSVPRVYLDTNIFIYLYETDGERHRLAWRIMNAMENGRIHALTSEITLAEVLVRPVRDGGDDLIAIYTDVLRSGPGFTVLPVDRPVIIDAARIRAASPGVKLPDALHVATARLNGTSHFASFDRAVPLPTTIERLDATAERLDKILGLDA